MWWWILVWVLLFVAAGVAMGLLGWHLVRRVIALGRQIGASAEQVSALLTPLDEPYRPSPSVLSDPSSSPPAPARRSARGRSRRTA